MAKLTVPTLPRRDLWRKDCTSSIWFLPDHNAFFCVLTCDYKNLRFLTERNVTNLAFQQIPLFIFTKGLSRLQKFAHRVTPSADYTKTFRTKSNAAITENTLLWILLVASGKVRMESVWVGQGRVFISWWMTSYYSKKIRCTSHWNDYSCYHLLLARFLKCKSSSLIKP